jgi:hypothetical protein
MLKIKNVSGHIKLSYGATSRRSIHLYLSDNQDFLTVLSKAYLGLSINVRYSSPGDLTGTLNGN